MFQRSIGFGRRMVSPIVSPRRRGAAVLKAPVRRMLLSLMLRVSMFRQFVFGNLWILGIVGAEVEVCTADAGLSSL
eukprot:7789077-Lingulodinium_polyedra.AAC.1